MIRRPQFWNPVQRYGEKMSKTAYVVHTRSAYGLKGVCIRINERMHTGKKNRHAYLYE